MGPVAKFRLKLASNEDIIVSEDLNEVRRKAPAHFYARADNARYCAWVLWDKSESQARKDAIPIGYNGAPQIALHHGFVRERSIALELILKAIIAATEAAKALSKAPPATHNVSQLWDMAGLPKPDEESRKRLLIAYRDLQWSSRYAAPIPSSKIRGEMQSDYQRSGNFVGDIEIYSPIPFGWTEFDNLYQLAQAKFFEMHQII